ncbi:MAG: precorrin-3B C(17)-methyltransferase, partial [Alphaproteobacteria bacterium]|nr:precorrin-3B C(17)-methyltransferase [Alphaproteobacteria bacterium]
GDDNGGVIVNVNKKTFYTFSSASLEQQTAKISSGSAVVKQITGSPSVAEAAALAALGNESRLLLPKRKSKAATCAVAVASPLVSATPPLPASQNKNFDNGLLAVIGLGPGAPEWCNYETLTLLAETEHWIGYHGYLTRLLPRAGTRRLHGFALGEEQERAALAIRLARHGHKAALISSGDPGIYAMASPLFEMLDEDKTADMPHIVVAPGISAVQATAARLGAPLGHDFCAISLSDLLTPPETIRKRLRAAAEADFVIALYNPASEERRSLLREAIQIIGDHRSADTRAVVARAVGHHNEKITNTTLGCIRADEVDMRCLVLIGNAGTRQVGRWLYTPRGYGAKR